jgi:hypothetical protein
MISFAAARRPVVSESCGMAGNDCQSLKGST